MANFIGVMISAIRQYKSMALVNQQLLEDLARTGKRTEFITDDDKLRELLNRLPEVSRSTMPVLLSGASGTGKEILCELIHNLSLRSNKPLIKANCATIPADMAEATLFGVAKGAATGVDAREGLLEAADGGTLFLDEIGEFPLELQAKLLRAAEQQEFTRVGSTRLLYTDVRFIYATNKDLRVMCDEGKFRSDLYYRISTYTVSIPPLCERKGDIARLIEHFSQRFMKGDRPIAFSDASLKILVNYRWPGNVRELRNLVERLCLLHAGEVISPKLLPPEMVQETATYQDKRAEAEIIEARRIRKALRSSGGNQSAAARVLNMSLSTMRRRMKKYGIAAKGS
jgi:transcriptional regulator with GAF, ATPase, and Fis domain